MDGGRFITLPCVVTQDPDTGERNVGMYRIQIYDDHTTGMHWQLQKVGARHGRRYYETGTRMPVAIFIGGDPVFTFAATAPLPDGLDEFLLAGYLRKKSVELVKCETNDLEVPANADFVIEGYVDPKEPLREEGPFGDHTGYYTLPEPYPVFHVTAITHRKDAVYPATIVGIPPMEDFYIGGASVKLFLPVFKMNFPEIVDIALPAEGVFHNLVFVSIKKTYPMQAYKIMHGLWGMGQMMFTKYIVVVDDDVDVHNTSEVLFRLCANTDPQRDSIFTKGPADVLDHATSEMAIGSKLGIDATKKLPGEGFKRAWPPLIKMDEAVKAKVEKFFNPKAILEKSYQLSFRPSKQCVGHLRWMLIKIWTAFLAMTDSAKKILEFLETAYLLLTVKHVSSFQARRAWSISGVQCLEHRRATELHAESALIPLITRANRSSLCSSD